VTPIDASKMIEEKLVAASGKSVLVQRVPKCSGHGSGIAASDEKRAQPLILAPTVDPESQTRAEQAARSLVAYDTDDSTATIAINFDEICRRI
jgi:hypothetical protein